MKSKKSKKPVEKRKMFQNAVLLSIVLIGGYAGYKLLFAGNAKASVFTPLPNGDGSTTTSSSTSCNEDEIFPLSMGAGTKGRPCAEQERVYVRTLQTFLNTWGPDNGMKKLFVDGVWGQKTEDNCKLWWKSYWKGVIDKTAYNNMVNALNNQ